MKNQPSTIYVLTDPRSGDIRYVGVTCKRIANRLWHHENLASKGGGSRCGAWIRELHALNLRPDMRAIEIEVSRDREIYWIDRLKRDGCKLLNATNGGGGTPGYKHSEEVRRKILERNIGRVHSPETRAAISAALKGTRATLRSIINQRKAKKGKKKSAETRAKMSAYQKGRPKPPEQVIASTRARRIKAIQQRDAFMPPLLRLEIISKRKEGATFRSIAEAYGVSTTWVRKQMKELPQ